MSRLLWNCIRIKNKFEKKKTYPTGLGRARGPDPTRRPTVGPHGAHLRPTEARRPAVSMADTPPPATPPYRARQGTRAPYKTRH
jgi:hypothetical protein